MNLPNTSSSSQFQVLNSDSINQQEHQLRLMGDWFERTYPVQDNQAVAVMTHRAGPRPEDWHQGFMQLEALLEDVRTGQLVIPAVFDASLTDCYAGLTLYYRNWRCASTVRWLPCCFVDLDCYKQGFTTDQAKAHLLEICRAHDIPEPTDITHTGRGLLARWELEPVRAWPEVVATWNGIQAKLCDLFESIGADHGARDCARVSRPDGTINSKSGAMVHTVKGSGDAYTLEQMALALGVLTRPRWKKQTKRIRVKTSVGVLVPKNPKQFTLAVEALRRIADLTELVQLRGTIHAGHRWNFMVAWVHSAKMASWPEDTIREQAHMFNDGWENGLEHGEVESAVQQGIRQVEKKNKRGKVVSVPAFKLTSQTIAQRLGITPVEQTYMATLVSSEERERRRIVRQLNSDTAKAILKAFERHPGARQVDLADITGFRQGTISKNLWLLGLKTTPHQDGRGRHARHGFTFPGNHSQSPCFQGS